VNVTQEGAFALIAFDEVNFGSRRVGQTDRGDEPRKTGPEPRSIQSFASGTASETCKLSAKCLVQIWSSVEGATRLMVRCHFRKSAA